jgi:hypothetical protein
MAEKIRKTELEIFWAKAQVFNRNIKSENPRELKLAITALRELADAGKKDQDLLAVTLKFNDPSERGRIKSWVAARRNHQMDMNVKKNAPALSDELTLLKAEIGEMLTNYKDTTTEEDRKVAVSRKKTESRNDVCCNTCGECCHAMSVSGDCCVACFECLCCPFAMLG